MKKKGITIRKPIAIHIINRGVVLIWPTKINKISNLRAIMFYPESVKVKSRNKVSWVYSLAVLSIISSISKSISLIFS